MNKSLRQLFTIVVALFVILGMSTTIIHGHPSQPAHQRRT